ncbi:MAG: lysoplasmalogenase [Sphingobacteriales bacterium]|jgi:uncharacterized membrane protein YhhN|nr:lysoplasmalogenase [Sphingobacteriales bacterium]MBP9141073.1 lysoplasmalogenase [Chitinophagales bacterium]MDA0198295.1 lysoplasmalogenase [Bacteroidota bacterium]MBK6890936.1 lysoplasmalogenase [Sphingobacteriales bacterium]MBK7526014.1 lysoplasmalogenase [Sphingobacteriales bacterium]
MANLLDKKNHLFLVAYWFFCVMVIVANYVPYFSSAVWMFKPLLMPCLAVWLWQNLNHYQTNNIPKTFKYYLFAALFFSWVGDISLMWSATESGFLSGLVAFLIAQLIYIVLFNKTSRPYRKSELHKNPWKVFPYIAYGLGLIYFLYPNLVKNNLLLPVIFYAVAILTMATMAVNRYGRVPYQSFKFCFVGAVLFVFSDSIIAVNKFYAPFDFANITITLTYCLAQYFIIKGLILQFSLKIAN